MRVYNFDPSVLEPFEIGAWLLSLLAWPTLEEAEGQWAAAEALCAQTLHLTCREGAVSLTLTFLHQAQEAPTRGGPSP